MSANLAVIDVTGDQERSGVTRSRDGLSESKFMEFCWDVQDQPNFRRQMDKESDYYDGNQLDQETMDDLRQKGLPELSCNLIKPTVDVVLGMEAKNRLDWRVTSDADKFTDVAEALSAKIHEAERESRADRACSDAYAGQIKVGLGWAEVSRNSDPFAYPFRVTAPHRREIYWDWRDREPDLTGGRYIVRRRWYDIDEAKLYFPGKSDVIEAAGSGWGAEWLSSMRESAELMHSFEQERGWSLEEWEYRDTIRRRICIFETWYRQMRRGYVLKLPDGQVVEMNLDNPLHAIAVARQVVRPIPAIYHKWGMAMFAGPHKLLDIGCQAKRHPYIPFFGYREDLTGTPYGLIRSMMSPQDEINARRRKLYWLLSAVRVLVDNDALDDKYNTVQEMLDEIARADAVVVMNPSRTNRQGGIQIDNNIALSEQQAKIMTNAEEMIQKVAGVFNALMGRDSASTSGIAIDSLVEQGMTVLAEINDNFRYSRRLVGEHLLDLIKGDIGRDQVEVVVGESAKNRRSVILNKRQVDPELGVTLTANDVQRAAVRVALEDVPSTPSYRKQQFTMLAEVLKGLAPEAQAVLTPFLLEQSDLPKRQQMSDALRRALNIPDGGEDGQQDPQVQMLTQQVNELTGMLQQAQVAIEDKTRREDRELEIKSRELDLKEKAESNKEKDLEAKAALADAKTAEANARAESLKADSARKDVEFALSQAVQQLQGVVQDVKGNVNAVSGKVESTQAANDAMLKSTTSALEDLQKAVKEIQADTGSEFKALRDAVSEQIGKAIESERARAAEREEKTIKAVKQAAEDAARRQEELADELREEMAQRRGFQSVTYKKDAEGNVIGGVADYGDDKREFKVVRGKDGGPTRLEFEDGE